MSTTPSLFPHWDKPAAPLAERLRPSKLTDLVGHQNLIGPEGWLRQLILHQQNLPHLVFWGPPGVGKTTLALAIAAELKAYFERASAVEVGVAEVRKVIANASANFARTGKRTVFFLDEIHRFNKAQQDALLGDLERATVTLMGATTENPAFSLNRAMLSRVQVVVLNPLENTDISLLLARATALLGITLASQANDALLQAAAGDARFALNMLETAAHSAKNGVIDAATIEQVLAGNPLRHDKAGDAHYDVVSAWIKSMRGSDPDAALYWGARLWEAGEDRRFLFRRLIIFASEDVGNADPMALQTAVAAAQGFERVGDAEGWILFAQAVSYLATAAKSNRSYVGYKAARAALERYGQAAVPKHLRNAPTNLAQAEGHGQGYVYPHDLPDAFAAQVRYLPEAMPDQIFYQPSDQGYERKIKQRNDQRRNARWRNQQT